MTRTRSDGALARAQRQRLLLIVGVLLLVLAVALVLATLQAQRARPEGTPQPPAPVATLKPTPSPTSPDAATALATLDGIPSATARADGYDRDLFGSGWLDTDGNGCDTRNDILQRDLRDETLEPGSTCVVVAGTLDDPYTATVIAFVRGAGTSDDVQIDHLVPLSWAWGYGADDWDEQRRKAFANDPRNLRAVEGSANMSKGDSGPGEWLPANAAHRCDYVASFVAVVAEYDLALPDADRGVIRNVLLAC